MVTAGTFLLALGLMADAADIVVPPDHLSAESAPAIPTESSRPPGTVGVVDGYDLLQRGDQEEALHHLNEAIEAYQRAAAVFHKRRVRSGEATAHLRIGLILQRQGKLPEAYKDLHKAAELYGRAYWPAQQGQALLAFGIVAEAIDRPEQARKAYEQAARWFLKVVDRPRRGETLIRLGRLLTLNVGVQAGLQYLERAIEDARERDDYAQIMKAQLAIGDAYLREEALLPALETYERVLRLADHVGDMRNRAAVRIRIARIYMETDRAAEGFPLVRTALGLYQNLRERRAEADTLSLMGNMFLAGHNPAEAARSHEHARELYRELHDPMREAGSLLNRGIVYEVKGDLPEARDVQYKAITLLQTQTR